MASSPDILIRNEIVTGLNAETFSLSFDAEAMYATDWDMKTELNQLQVGIWASDTTAEAWERNKMLETFRIGMTIVKKVSAATVSELDDLLDFVREIVKFIELSVAVVPSGDRYVNQALEYLLRFNDSTLDRNKGTDGIPKYTGLFSSVVVFDFVSLE